MGTKMLQRRGTAAEWSSVNPILSEGELGFELDTGILKIGDGVTHWNDLANFNGLDGDVGPAGPQGDPGPSGTAGGDSSWTAATLTSPWSAAGYQPNRFRKDGLGFVHIEGSVIGATATTSIVFTLPVGYRCDQTLLFPAIRIVDLEPVVFQIQPETGVCSIIMPNTTSTSTAFSCSFLANE